MKFIKKLNINNFNFLFQKKKSLSSNCNNIYRNITFLVYFENRTSIHYWNVENEVFFFEQKLYQKFDELNSFFF